MITTWILIFIGVVVGIAILSFLMKSFVKLILVLGIIYLLFQLGFIWNAQDLQSKLHLDKFLKPQVSKQIETNYNQFAQKRDSTGILETNLIKKEINDSINQALTNASNRIENVDKKKLIADLNAKLTNFDAKSVSQVLDSLKAQLAKYHVTPQEVISGKPSTP
ncbi:hypothetical protein PP175_26905 (plasmid) [Aneurinibacillus sp. Ricciae_BoGa-3]|uniref:hypothetical protein n=1 Tax=Aneurinibacillus sp. Ricciae_BoGa-3 TaxID=3022697 RepID=UPI00233FE0C8|nr:hypothetical protein [Aneurinibacillus sp. Ricciae_BoGa-3]WCK57668.1 hypothetical protein PP175_26905 [Aneurinibacillus sp. Ricciae_BoGa-3]